MSIARLLLILALFATVGACDTIRKVAGIDKTAPDEFTVISRAPLDLPPDFSLRPPQAGALRPQETSLTQQARQTVFRAGDGVIWGVGPAFAFPTADMQAFERPVLFVLGGLSNPAYYRRMAERLATSFPDFRLEVFDGRHHFDPPHRAEPERYARLLEDHWRRAESRSQ